MKGLALSMRYRILFAALLLTAAAAGCQTPKSSFVDRGIDCAAGPQFLSAAPATANLQELELTNLQTYPLRSREERLGDPKVVVLSGKCADLVGGANLGTLGLTNGAFLKLEPRIGPTPEDRTIFRPSAVSAAQAPAIVGATFLDADRIQSRLEGDVLMRRYVGLWKEPDGWLVAEFTRSDKSGESTEVRQLLRSSLPIRGLTFFPAPDTPTGTLTLVQDGPGVVRVLSFLWAHGALKAH
jgi:hypothetical protein